MANRPNIKWVDPKEEGSCSFCTDVNQEEVLQVDSARKAPGTNRSAVSVRICRQCSEDLIVVLDK